MTYSIIVVSLVVIFFGYLIYQKQVEERLFINEIRNWWVHGRSRDRNFQQIATYHSLQSKAALSDSLDDRTWEDMNMNEIFAEADRGMSPIGQQYLYSLLHAPQKSKTELLKFDRLTKLFSAEQSIREKFQQVFKNLDVSESYYLPHYFLGELELSQGWHKFVPVLSVISILTIALSYFFPPTLFLLILVVPLNTIIHYFFQQKMNISLQSLRSLKLMIYAGKAIAAIKNETMAEYSQDLPKHLAKLKKLERRLKPVIFDKSNVDELSKGVMQIISVVTLFEVTAFILTLEMIRQTQDELHKVFITIGYLEAAISIASFRNGLPYFSTPQFSEPKKSLIVEELYHPLIKKPVANNLNINGRSLLITGSNMSGKTTFLRTLGVNAILAQTVYTTFAKSYQAPFLNVKSVIGRADNLLEGKSYYLAEVEAVNELVKLADKDEQHLFIVDELLRGTNTTERIAAGKAVLEYLNQKNHLALAATHDKDLSQLLGNSFEYYYFQECIENNELSFDYKIRNGVTTTRNAIALLDIFGYPKVLVKNALDTATLIESQ
jgi:MutS domain V